MLWCLIICFCFSIPAFGSRMKPEPKRIESNILNIATDRRIDCYTQKQMKTLIIDVLEHAKRSPSDIDFLISTLKSEINPDFPVSELKEHNGEFYPNFKGPLDCFKVLKSLTAIAYNALKELKEFPACFRHILPLGHFKIDHSIYNTANSNMYFSNILDIIFQEIHRIDKLNNAEVTTDKMQVNGPKISWLQWVKFKQFIPEKFIPNDIKAPLQPESIHISEAQESSENSMPHHHHHHHSDPNDVSRLKLQIQSIHKNRHRNSHKENKHKPVPVYPNNEIIQQSFNPKFVMNTGIPIFNEIFDNVEKSNLITYILNKKQQIIQLLDSSLKWKFNEILNLLNNAYRNGLIVYENFYNILQFLLHPDIYNLSNTESVNCLWYLLNPDENGQINTKNLYLINSLINDRNSDNQNKKITINIDIRTECSKIIAKFKVNNDNKNNNASKNDNDNKNNNANKVNDANLNPEYVDLILALLQLNNKENDPDPRGIDILHKIILLKQKNIITSDDLKIIFTFLKADSNRDTSSKRIDVAVFVINNLLQMPTLHDVFIKLLTANDVNSKYIDILLSLSRKRMLSIQLLEVLVTLLQQQKRGNEDKRMINKLIIMLKPYEYTKPKTVTHVLNILHYSNYQPTSNNDNTDVLTSTDTNHQTELSNLEKENGYSQTLKPEAINSEHLTYLLNKYGLMELTYMIKKPIPLVQYVKFRIPMIKFLTIVKSLVVKNPHLLKDPTKLLQELIIRGKNMSEIYPILNDVRKEDIVKFTIEDGNLVEAKMLEEMGSNLNKQVKLAHTLEAEISPEEILQQNYANSAKFFTATASNKGNARKITSLIDRPTDYT